MTTSEIIALWHTFPLSSDNNMDKLERQIELNPAAWEAVAVFLKENDLSTLEDGKHPIKGGDLFVNITTAPLLAQ